MMFWIWIGLAYVGGLLTGGIIVIIVAAHMSGFGILPTQGPADRNMATILKVTLLSLFVTQIGQAINIALVFIVLSQLATIKTMVRALFGF